MPWSRSGRRSPQDTICWLIRRMPRRCWECIQACWGHSYYWVTLWVAVHSTAWQLELQDREVSAIIPWSHSTVFIDCVINRTTRGVPNWGIRRSAWIGHFLENFVLVSTWSVLFRKLIRCYVVVSVCVFISALWIQLNCFVVLRHPAEIEVLRMCSGWVLTARAWMEQKSDGAYTPRSKWK